MRPILPLDVLVIDQPQISLVDQRRSLQRVPPTFVAHVMVRHPAQFLVNQRHQAVESALVAIAPIEQQSGDVLRRGSHRAAPLRGKIGIWNKDARIINATERGGDSGRRRQRVRPMSRSNSLKRGSERNGS
jgi:hypothetical protein